MLAWYSAVACSDTYPLASSVGSPYVQDLNMDDITHVGSRRNSAALTSLNDRTNPSAHSGQDDGSLTSSMPLFTEARRNCIIVCDSSGRDRDSVRVREMYRCSMVSSHRRTDRQARSRQLHQSSPKYSLRRCHSRGDRAAWPE